MKHHAIAVVPAGDVARTVDLYRERYAKYTRYVIPPHVTIYPPFVSHLASETGLLGVLQTAFRDLPPFGARLPRVDFFATGNNVAFFAPDDDSSRRFAALHRTAVACLETTSTLAYGDYVSVARQFVPHMTIAERIPDAVFPRVREELGRLEIDLCFPVAAVVLFEQEAGSEVWIAAATIPFGLS